MLKKLCLILLLCLSTAYANEMTPLKDKIHQDEEQLKQDKVVIQGDRKKLHDVSETIQKDRQHMMDDMRKMQMDRAAMQRDHKHGR